MIEYNETMSTNWQLGDILKWTHPNGNSIYYQIITIRDIGYSCIYPDHPEIGMTPYTGFDSENSADPFLEHWTFVSNMDIPREVTEYGNNI